VTDDRPTSGDPFVHEALFYRDMGEYLEATLAFIDEGLRADEPVLVAVPSAKLRRLTDELGAAAARVRLIDMTEEGRNPGRIIPWVHLAFANAHADGALRIIGEPIWPGRTADEYPGCVQHEALANVIFSGRRAKALCPYDVSNLEPHVLADAATTHPVVIGRDGRNVSADYADPHAVASAFNRPLRDLGTPLVLLWFNAATVREVRLAVAQQAAYAGMEPDRATDLHQAVNEVARNAVTHGGGAGTLAIYRDPDRLICQIRDAGRIADPLAGRIPARSHDDSGHGLLLVNRLCDLVQTYTGDGGTTTRLHMRIAPNR
jgi:anti-sigma regulatory factor (Ser/Thr protein kinase)